MRLAIHGRESVVPPMTGLALPDAAKLAANQGLQLTVENRFYSMDVPAGHVINQDPPPGFRVRRDWPVRVTESFGPQKIGVPNLIGQSERAALIKIRQLGLEPGTVIRMAAPGDTDVVLGQSPTPDAGEVASPHISLLVSEPETQETAYMMPTLVGLTYGAAQIRAAPAGLRLLPEEQTDSSQSDATPKGSAPPAATSLDQATETVI